MDHTLETSAESSPDHSKNDERSYDEEGASIPQRSHPLYKQLSLISGEVNSYKLDDLRRRLAELKLNDRSVVQNVLIFEPLRDNAHLCFINNGYRVRGLRGCCILDCIERVPQWA